MQTSGSWLDTEMRELRYSQRYCWNYFMKRDALSKCEWFPTFRKVIVSSTSRSSRLLDLEDEDEDTATLRSVGNHTTFGAASYSTSFESIPILHTSNKRCKSIKNFSCFPRSYNQWSFGTRNPSFTALFFRTPASINIISAPLQTFKLYRNVIIMLPSK